MTEKEEGLGAKPSTILQPDHFIVATQSIWDIIRTHTSKLNLPILDQLTPRQGLYYYHDKVFVPPEARLQVLQYYHNSPAAGHGGVRQTKDLIQRTFWWPKLQEEVSKFVSSCDTCARAKERHQKPSGLLQPLPIPARPWSDVSMDFITDLPQSQQLNTLMVVVDRLTKMAHFVPYTHLPSASETADLFIREIFRLHGLPENIVSDRGTQFTSHFWKAFCSELHIHRSLTTAFHPQSNGQTERTNQTLEQYLRCFTTHLQDDWSKYLPLAEFAYNNHIHSSTGKSPFIVNYGFHPSMLPGAPIPSSVPSATLHVRNLTRAYTLLRNTLLHSQQCYKAFADRHRTTALVYRTGDKVWLSTKHLKLSCPSKKLGPRFLGPFSITEVISPLVMRLRLPPSMKIHPVFHVSLLKPWGDNPFPGRLVPPLDPILVDGVEEYEVEEILDSRLHRGQLQYLIHWKGYGPADRSWQSARLVHADELVRAFHTRYPDRPGRWRARRSRALALTLLYAPQSCRPDSGEDSNLGISRYFTSHFCECRPTGNSLMTKLKCWHSARLQVTSCDWHHAANRTAHHTNVYESSDLILRRGQPFILTFTFSRSIQAGENILFVCETGPSPSEASKTKAVFPLFGSQKKDTWSAVQTFSASNSLTVTLNSPSSAVIGRYRLNVAVFKESIENVPLQSIGELSLIFNPWVQEDDVFLAEENERQEYVLNEYGVIFVGSEYELMSRDWEYNQFDKDVLKICFSILDRSMNHQKDAVSDVSQRNDPLYVCRALNATVNSKDENGVLVENWSGDYSDAVSPVSWNGSVPILKQWYFQDFTPVKYGQCWVYGGVLCTVLRCLGIPTRIITNFNSAQDRNKNLFIDLFYNSYARSQETAQDLMWNFHVWNEAWFKRKDLGSAYDGWQVMDATPLETSNGIYCCGPAPLNAIKEGEADLNYDVGFMFASVNADVGYWIHYTDGSKKRTSNDTKSIGKFISTKAIGTDDREDVTHTYKYLEGTKKEREVFEKAVDKMNKGSMEEIEKNFHIRRRGVDNPKQTFMLFGHFTMTDNPTVGKDVKLLLNMKNLTAINIRVIVHMTASSILYTGRHRHEIWTDAKLVPLYPQQEINISIVLRYDQYGKYLSEDDMIRTTALCEVDGSEERILVERDIMLEKLPIRIKIPSQAQVIFTTFNVEIVISNPMYETLDSCSLTVEGSGLVNGQLRKDLPPLKPGEEILTQFTINPFKSGLRTLLVIFTSDKIKNAKGSHKVLITGSN
ncbi:protein-glutamine gamma-glutamyltransferase E-like [Pelodytes ibericus]